MILQLISIHITAQFNSTLQIISAVNLQSENIQPYYNVIRVQRGRIIFLMSLLMRAQSFLHILPDTGEILRATLNIRLHIIIYILHPRQIDFRSALS